ncbi:uncharacterized protein LOC129614515 [Condylostylus longicornis]|uniref:uncharacterized protein LOC129614515 n=1 Tax=Condylostylus longicornis TaxID=2530218 RepID=UPI00244DEABB|nr:uncharacterized protein LOC129614515 [Condylostylus longicornis]
MEALIAEVSENKSETAPIDDNKNLIANGTCSSDEQSFSKPMETSSKERELLDLVFSLESEKQTIIDESKAKIGQFKKDLIDSLSENDKLKRKVAQLEQTLKQSVTCGGSPSKVMADQEDALLRAKTLLFEKTKICKQQEQHIEMLKTQVDSIKDVLNVTKEMLNLRSAEIEHLNARYETATLRTKAEKDKNEILEKKLNISKNVYEKLRTEHEIQCKIFKELKEAYEAKIKVLTTAKKLKEED